MWARKLADIRISTQEPHMTTQTPLVTGVDFLCMPVKDIAVAKEFYGSVLGLPLSVEYDMAPGAEFEAGPLTLQLIDAEAIGREFKPHPFPLAFHVEDVEAARSELESRGVTFLADTLDSGVCHMAAFQDPDGNVLMLHNRYAPRG
jgi:predicted enzyme related to lactoylglutathione lyase